MTRRILITASTVAVLALVIFAVSAISSPKKPADSTHSVSQLSSQTRASDLAEQAESAQSRNDTEIARALATSALKLESGNVVARRVIAALDRTSVAVKPSSTDAPASAKPPTASTSAPGAYSVAVADIGKLLPVAITNWTAGAPVARGGDGLVTFEPKRATSAYRSAVRATFSVHDRKTAPAATAFLTKVDKTLYAADGASAQVGVASGYFGTDGTQLAVFAFARGRYAFEVVLYARPGTKPAALKSVALQLADSLPAAH